MRLATYHRRSLWHYRRTNLAVVLGAAVATSALTGALIVGDSMRASLRDAALGRLGRVDHALVAQRFFRAALAAEIAGADDTPAGSTSTAPVILLTAGVTHADSRSRSDGINLFGVDRRFWNLDTVDRSTPAETASDRTVVLNQPLADELGAEIGDDVLVRTAKPSAISTETLLGRRDDTTSTIRLTVASIIPARGLGAFTLGARQAAPKNAFVPLATLQRSLKRPDSVNAILVAGSDVGAASSPDRSAQLQDRLAQSTTLADLGLSLRIDEALGYISLESESILIEPPVEEAAIAAARDVEARATSIFTHLANTLTRVNLSTNGSHETASSIPYSMIAAIDASSPTMTALTQHLVDGSGRLQPGELFLNQWAADDLDAHPGDTISVEYYVTGSYGQLQTHSATFTLRGVVEIRGAAADPGFIPEYKGVTDTENLADWDPPFPVDLTLVRDKDETYWDDHRTTPKAFVTLQDGQRLWAQEGERFGRLTSMRIHAASTDDVTVLAQWFSRALRLRLDPRHLGLSFEPVRWNAIRASSGSTDFGGLFVGFSFFLIGSAAMLVVLLFRLGIERRSAEIGLLMATGFSPKLIARALLVEGFWLSTLGGAIGLAGAIGYSWLMLAGLRSWWADAVHSPFLQLHVSPATCTLGAVLSVLLAAGSARWSIRGLTRRTPRQLLAGAVGETALTGCASKRRFAPRLAVVSIAVAIASSVGSMALVGDRGTRATLFFLSGTSMLVGCLAILRGWLRRTPRGLIRKPGAIAMLRLAIRNIPRHAGRSTLTVSLIASATFVIVALEAFRAGPGEATPERASATGGFALYAQSAVPIGYDLNTARGRDAMNVTDPMIDPQRGVHIVPFRLRPGDASSCLNLYMPSKPRIIGATPTMVQRGGFRFTSTLAETDKEIANPWTLLNRTFDDGAVPAIGDAEAVLWQLHLGLGKDLIVPDERGRDVTLRFVALLRGSALQDEIIVAERRFNRLFPSIDGHSFFLIAAPPDIAQSVERILERELEGVSFDVGSMSKRLADYNAVKNTYLSTFQLLGGLGLLLGTAGMGAVLLRNVWERRKELALLRATGFSRRSVALLVLGENAALVVSGLTCGCAAALLAISPALVGQPDSVPWESLALTLLLVLVTGLLAGGAAVRSALGATIVDSLRNE